MERRIIGSKVREGLETLYKEGFRKGLRGFSPT